MSKRKHVKEEYDDRDYDRYDARRTERRSESRHEDRYSQGRYSEARRSRERCDSRDRYDEPRTSRDRYSRERSSDRIEEPRRSRERHSSSGHSPRHSPTHSPRHSQKQNSNVKQENIENSPPYGDSDDEILRKPNLIKTIKGEFAGTEPGLEWKEKRYPGQEKVQDFAENNQEHPSFVTEYLYAHGNKEKRRQIIDTKFKNCISKWNNMEPDEWIEAYGKIFHDIGLTITCAEAGPFEGFPADGFSCIYTFTRFDNINDVENMHTVPKYSRVTQETVKRMAAIACIQLMHDKDVISNRLLTEYFLPNTHFLPKCIFENEDINGKILNVDQNESDIRNANYQNAHKNNDEHYVRHKAGEMRPLKDLVNLGDPHGGYEAGTSKSRIHKFGELYMVPTKVTSKPYAGPMMARPVRGRKMNAENISTLEFWFEMRLYSCWANTVTKKEDERQVCLSAVSKLYWAGKINYQGVQELTKKKIQKRKREVKRDMQETQIQRVTSLKELDIDGCYTAQNAPTRRMLLNKQLWSGQDRATQDILTSEKMLKNNLREFESKWTLRTRYPEGLNFPNRMLMKTKWHLDPPMDYEVLIEEPIDALEATISITTQSIHAKKSLSVNLCIRDMIIQLYRWGIIEPYITLMGDINGFLPKFDPNLCIAMHESWVLKKTDRERRCMTRYDLSGVNFQNRLEWMNRGEFDNTYRLYGKGGPLFKGNDEDDVGRTISNKIFDAGNGQIVDWDTLRENYPGVCHVNDAHAERIKLEDLLMKCKPNQPIQEIVKFQDWIKSLNQMDQIKNNKHRLDLLTPYKMMIHDEVFLKNKFDGGKQQYTAIFRENVSNEDMVITDGISDFRPIFSLEEFLENNLPEFLSWTEVDLKDKSKTRMSVYFNDKKVTLNIVKCPYNFQQCTSYQLVSLNIRALLAQKSSNFQKRAKQRYHKAYWLIRKLSPKNSPWNDEVIVLTLAGIYDHEKGLDKTKSTKSTKLSVYMILVRVVDLWSNQAFLCHEPEHVPRGYKLRDVLAFPGTCFSEEEGRKRQYRLDAFMTKSRVLFNRLSDYGKLESCLVKNE